MSSQLRDLKITIADDHRLLLDGTIGFIRDRYPNATLTPVQTVGEALATVARDCPDLFIGDLSLPETEGGEASVEKGLEMLRSLMREYPTLNLMVLSSNVKSLVRLVHDIDNHQGGFTIADKSLPPEEFLIRLKWSLEGLSYTKDLKTDLEIKPEWFEVMQLAFEVGLQDKAIAKEMHRSERTIRHYWSKIQDALGIYPEEGINMRSLIQIRAREEGLIG